MDGEREESDVNSSSSIFIGGNQEFHKSEGMTSFKQRHMEITKG